MAAVISTKKDTLKQIFDKVYRVFYFPSATLALGAQKDGIELPVLADGVTFNTGDPDITNVKLTDETTWVSKSAPGDADISFQVASVNSTISNLFLSTASGSAISAVDIGFGSGSTVSESLGAFDGLKYSLTPKKVVGALLMMSEDKSTGVYLPNVEMYASFNGEGGDDSTGYFNVQVTPLANSDGAEFIILTKHTS